MGLPGLIADLWAKTLGGTAPSGAASLTGDMSQMQKALIAQILNGTAPAGAASATGDISQMTKYVAAGSVAAYQPVTPQLPVAIPVPNPAIMTAMQGWNGTTGVLGIYASGAWPTANDAYFMPFTVDQSTTVVAVHVQIGTTSGNIDVGLYNTNGTKIVSKGSTAMSASGSDQRLAFGSPQTLSKGRYLLGIAIDNTTAVPYTYPLRSGSGAHMTAFGFFKQASAFPLPSPATLASPTWANSPAAILEIQ